MSRTALTAGVSVTGGWTATTLMQNVAPQSSDKTNGMTVDLTKGSPFLVVWNTTAGTKTVSLSAGSGQISGLSGTTVLTVLANSLAVIGPCLQQIYGTTMNVDFGGTSSADGDFKVMASPV